MRFEYKGFSYEPSPQQKALLHYAKNAEEVNLLTEQIANYNMYIEGYDVEIEQFEAMRKDEYLLDETLDSIAEKRNNLNLERIKLELRKNRLEKEMLMFEYEQAIE